MQDEEFRKILAAYDQATQELQKTHESLRAQVAHLSGELSEKNRELTSSLEEVSALKNYLANILESITDGVIAINPEREVMAFNQSAAQAALAMSQDHLGRPLTDVLPAACAELGRLLVRALSEERGFTNVEISLATTPRRVLSVSASPIRNLKGEILGAVETFRDLTEIKALEERAARQDRLAELGEMAAGVAHEIRNPLGGIELYASSLKRRLAPDSKEAEIAGRIGEAAVALNRIVTDMLNFTRQRELQRKPTDPERVLRTAWDMAARERAHKEIIADWDVQTGGRKVPLDADQLAQAALNVILNASQFMQDGGHLEICARFSADPGDGGAIAAANQAAEYLHLEFTDDGPGISDENLGKLFNPFFTTRKDGTGLGLAIVHKIISDHGGSITVANRPPRGACFQFHLPVVEAI